MCLRGLIQYCKSRLFMSSQIHQRISDGDPDRLDRLVVTRYVNGISIES